MIQFSLPFADRTPIEAVSAFGEAVGTLSEAARTFRDAAGPPGDAPCSVEFFRHPRARRYVVRVRADGSVRVTIPRWGSRREAEAFVARERAWIEKQRGRAAAQRSESGDEPRPEVERAIRARAARELPVRLVELASEHGLTVSRVSVRNQQWRWGSCSPHGHICLNWRLVGMPDWVRDYVMLHELMHLKRMDHSPKFWTLVERACPQYREARAWLRTNQPMLTGGAPAAAAVTRREEVSADP